MHMAITTPLDDVCTECGRPLDGDEDLCADCQREMDKEIMRKRRPHINVDRDGKRLTKSKRPKRKEPSIRNKPPKKVETPPKSDYENRPERPGKSTRQKPQSRTTERR